VYAGLPDVVRPACHIAADAAAYAAGIAQLLARSAGERREIASRACLDRLTWEACLQPLAGILGRSAEAGA
jgi:hypothetical protein